jgi:hypothetical protein
MGILDDLILVTNKTREGTRRAMVDMLHAAPVCTALFRPFRCLNNEAA